MLTVEGWGPYHGSIDVRRYGRGLIVINDLELDQYVAGIREVPGRWPMEALKAQAVAARTYALWEKQRGYWQSRGFDVCGTTTCQVYQGVRAELGERGRRWLRAVRATAGQVLLHQDKPILARYHASSGGRTLANEVVYPSAGPRPYLRAIDDPADRVSPLHRWKVRFPRGQLEHILRVGVRLGGVLTSVEARFDERNVVIRTRGGKLAMSSVRFRRVVSSVAPRLYPSRYPGFRSDGKPMPTTIPSSRFTIRRVGDAFEVDGRGYGHGVGMSQWGAKGRADEGASYSDILAAYYGGLRPQPWRGSRGMRVATALGASSIRVLGDGAFGVFSGRETLSSSTVGGWSVVTAGARSLQVSPPSGFRLPLVLTGVDTPRSLFVDPPKEGGSLHVDFVVPKAVEVNAVLKREGDDVARAHQVVEAGERRIVVPLDPGRLARRATYRLDLTAYDGTKQVSAARNVVLVRPAPSIWPKLLIAAVLLAVIAFVLRRRSASRAG